MWRIQAAEWIVTNNHKLCIALLRDDYTVINELLCDQHKLIIESLRAQYKLLNDEIEKLKIEMKYYVTSNDRKKLLLENMS